MSTYENINVEFFMFSRKHNERNIYRRILIQSRGEVEIGRLYGADERVLRAITRCLVPVAIFETLAFPITVLVSYGLLLYLRKIFRQNTNLLSLGGKVWKGGERMTLSVGDKLAKVWRDNTSVLITGEALRGCAVF